MVTIVVLINVFISIMLFYLAQQLRKVKDNLVLITDIFNQYECACYTALQTLPDNIYLAKEKIENLYLEKQIFQQKIQQFRQILSLIVLLRQISQGSLPFPYLNLKNPSKLG